MLARALILAALAMPAAAQAGARECSDSPGRVLQLCISVDGGRAVYEVSRHGRPVIAPSTVGLAFAGEPAVRWSTLTEARRSSTDTTWEQPWGEQRVIADRHNELKVTLGGDTPYNRRVIVTARVFDDGGGSAVVIRRASVSV